MKRKLSLFLIAFGAFIVIYPVIFLLAGSFMHPAELEEHLAPIVSPASQGFADWSLLPQIPTLRSYAKVLLEEPQFFMVFWNSVKIVAGVVAGQLLFGVPAAWLCPSDTDEAGASAKLSAGSIGVSTMTPCSCSRSLRCGLRLRSSSTI